MTDEQEQTDEPAVPTLEPLSDRLVVLPIEEPELTAGGVVLPDQAKEKPQRGTIIALGPEAEVPVGQFDGDGTPAPLSVGDTIIFSKYGGTEFSFEGRDYMVLRVADILSRIPAPARNEENEGATDN